MIPDPFKRTVKIPVKVVCGVWLQVDGQPLPAIAEGAVGDLVLGAHSLTNEDEREKWTSTEDREMFPATTALWAVVNASGPFKGSPPEEKRLKNRGESVLAVRIDLQGPLILEGRAGKYGMLKPCKCMIPALGTEVESVNEAYTRISEAYESHRRSHSGSVFQKVCFEESGSLRPLEDRRGERLDV